MLKTVLTTAALGLAVVSTPALAGPSDNPSVEIAIADINLATPEGQERLDRRVKKAAQALCGVGTRRSGSRIPSMDSKRCYAKAMKSAEQQVATLIEAQQRGG